MPTNSRHLPCLETLGEMHTPIAYSGIRATVVVSLSQRNLWHYNLILSDSLNKFHSENISDINLKSPFNNILQPLLDLRNRVQSDATLSGNTKRKKTLNEMI